MSFNQASEDVKNFANRLKPIIELGAFLEKIGSIENAGKEAEAFCAKAKAQAEEATVKLGDVQAELVLSEAKVKEAESKAEAVVNLASKNAEDIVARAKSKAQEIEQAVMSVKASVAKQISESQVELEAVKKEIQDKRAELELVKKEAAEFKSKFLSLVK